jgi:voltage-gated potassium channel
MDHTTPLRARTPEDEERLLAFERRAATPILVSALLPIILSLAGADSIIAGVVLIATWLVFVVDLVVHTRLVPGYLRSRRGLVDVVIVVLTGPWFLIPGLGESRFLVLARLARLVRALHAAGSGLRRLAQQIGAVGIATAVLVVTSAYVAYSAERSVNEAFSSFGEALWWATVTVTTVGYGEIVPVTSQGRLIAVVLMFAGLAVLGALAASLAAFLGFGDQTPPDQAPVAAPGSIAEESAELALRGRLDELERVIAAVRQQLP